MKTAKVLLSTSTICCIVLAIMFLWNSDVIISNIGVFSYRILVSLFTLNGVVLTKEATSIKIEEDYELL